MNTDAVKIQKLLSIAHEIGLGRAQKLIGEEWALLIGREFKGNAGKTINQSGSYFIKVPPEYGSETLVATHDKDGRLTDGFRNLLEGMSISVDVSTDESNAGNRLFGTISEVMDSKDEKFGVILLVNDQEANYEGG